MVGNMTTCGVNCTQLEETQYDKELNSKALPSLTQHLFTNPITQPRLFGHGCQKESTP